MNNYTQFQVMNPLFAGKPLSATQRKKIRRAALLVEQVVKELKDSDYPVYLDERLRTAAPSGAIQATPLADEAEVWLALTHINRYFGLIAFKTGRLMG